MSCARFGRFIRSAGGDRLESRFQVKRAARIFAILVLGLFGHTRMYAQAPTGAIEGRVTDPAGGVIVDAGIELVNHQTALLRHLATEAQGDFAAPALPPGVYKISATAPGFRKLVLDATIEAGTTTTVNLVMQVGPSTETIAVSSVAPQMQYDSFDLTGVTTRPQIEGLPLNGRNFLELAKLEPGAVQPMHGSNNRTFLSLLGAPSNGNPGNKTLVTVDGGNIMQIGNGGAAMGFSQEVVQEFQVSSVNLDLSTGMTASGSVNVATRSGGNQWHGSAFYFFRNHDLAAYPGLRRNPFYPDPFFQRQQYGGSIGGPIIKDRLFVFGAFERNDQRGVVSTVLLTPEFAPLSRITASPTAVDQFGARIDWIVSPKNTLFLRQSHEGGFAYAPTTVNGQGSAAYPSAWTQQPEWTDQSILGLTSQLSSNFVNEFRFSYFFVSSSEDAPTESDCPGCLGIGAPAINVADLFIGNSTTTTELGRRFHLNDVVAAQKNTHTIRFGGDWELTRGGRTDLNDNPVTMNLFSPEDVALFNSTQAPSNRIPLPLTFLTLPDILQLPLMNFQVGIGNPDVPQANFGNTRISPLAHLFIQDTWRLRPQLTLIYGLGWSFDGPLNYDLRKPVYLEPVVGAGGLVRVRHNWTNFSPSVGFAWSPAQDSKTLIRGGFGIYYDTQLPADDERVSLGPRGVGRGTYFGEGIANPLTDVPGVPAGTLLNFATPTQFTGASLLDALPTIQAQLAEARGDPNNQDFSVVNIQTDKQGSIVNRNMPNESGMHIDVGAQRQIGRDFVINADFVARLFNHISADDPGFLDANHFLSARGPVLPICVTDAERNDPNAECSLGPISVSEAIGSARYLGLLVRAEKRFSHGIQFLASYALSSDVGNGFDVGFDNDHPLANYGPLSTGFENILNVSGLVQLPKHFPLAYFATYVSRPAFSAYLGGIDLNGDGTTGDLLPGTKVGEFNHGLGKSDLVRLVDVFNKTYAGKFDAQGALIPLISLPPKYQFGDPLVTQDLRLSRTFSFREHAQLALIGEVFNLFNIANLSGRDGDLTDPGFGQARSRITQVFGSGGPRAFQFAVRLSF
jgi:hypothetical protein